MSPLSRTLPVASVESLFLVSHMRYSASTIRDTFRRSTDVKDKSASDAATRIRDAMIARGISNPSELARRLGVPRQTVHRWLNGDVRNMTHEHLFRLGDALNISGRWLALGDVDPSKYKVKD